MSFGYTARNSSNSVLVSDRSYNTVYAGKAVLQQTYGMSYAGDYSIAGSGTYALNMQFRRYRFDAGGALIIPFLYNPSAGFGGVVYTVQVGNAYDFYVVTPPNIVPVIYCFVKSSSTGKTGWGMSLFDASGKTTFTTSDNILSPKAVYSAVTANSNVAYGDPIGFGAPFPYTGAAIQTNTPLNTVPSVAKPAILYNSYGTAECTFPATGNGGYWESIARFDNTTKNLLTHWGFVAPYAANLIQTPQRDEIAVVIDGAEYD